MRRIQKLATAALALLLLLAAATACSTAAPTPAAKTEPPAAPSAAESAQPAGTPAPVDPFKDPVEISVAYWDIETGLADVANDAVYQAFTKQMNITIKPVNITWDDYSQKINVWASSSSLPDVFAIDAIGTAYYNNWITQGVVRALPQDMSAYPNLVKYISVPDIQGLAVDGKMYCIPRKTYDSVDYNVLDRMVSYRWDLAQQAGITKEPETWDEFKAMLSAIVTKDPGGTKIGGITIGNVKQLGGLFWLYSDPAATSDGSGSDFKWIKEDGKFIPAVFSKTALASLQNVRDMYTAGLIDKDIALIKGSQGTDKFVAGKAAAILYANGFINTGKLKQAWDKVYPDKKFNDCVKQLKPLVSADGTRYHAVFKTYWSESYFNSAVDDKKMDRILRVFDFLVSPEGVNMMHYGIEGTDFTVDGSGKVAMTDPATFAATKYPSVATLANIVSWDAVNFDPAAPLPDNGFNAEKNEFMAWVIANTKVPAYEIRLTYLSTPAKGKFTVLDHDDMLQIMMGAEPVEKMWNDLLAAYKAKGLDTMIDEVNAKAQAMGIN